MQSKLTGRSIESPTPKLAGLLALSLLLAQCEGTPPERTVQNANFAVPGNEVFVFRNGRQIKLTISQTEVGIVIPDPALQLPTADDSRPWVSVLAESGFRRAETFPRGIFVYERRGNLAVAQIEALYRQLERQDGVRHAGFVVRLDGEKNPMIMTDDFVVRLVRADDLPKLDQLNATHDCELVRVSKVNRTRVVLRRTAETELDTASVAREYAQADFVRFAEPDLIPILVPRSARTIDNVPGDLMFPQQWHHSNGGGAGAVDDADIDTPKAWDLTTGSASVVIAVVDGEGFEVGHEDLAANLWTNPGEDFDPTPTDDDGNGFADDVHGWNFLWNTDNLDLYATEHGTKAAGCVGAVGDNGIGIAGTCWTCRLMLVTTAYPFSSGADSVDYAVAEGAAVITMSWGMLDGSMISEDLETALEDAATVGRGGKGCVTFAAVTDLDQDRCDGEDLDIPALNDSVIAVGSSTKQDLRYTGLGFGPCLDVLGPSGGIVTTAPGGTYTTTFDKNSAATPVVAGIAGLVLAVDPTLERLEVQRLIQDTCDKIGPTLGEYGPNDGRSASTHGYGRANAYEAVRIAASGGIDVFVRDNVLDWGNTEQPSNRRFELPDDFIPHWQSADIKIDAPPFEAAEPATSAEFDAFADENPIASATNRVYLRVHNRGPNPAAAVTAKLLWTQVATVLPDLPSDFWTAFPADSAVIPAQWHPVSTASLTDLRYSGASVAGTADDLSQIVRFDFDAPSVAPVNHYCLLAIVTSPSDPLAASTVFVVDELTPNYNNVTHRNVVLVDPGTASVPFFLRNTGIEPIPFAVEVEVAPLGLAVTLTGTGGPELGPGEERLVHLAFPPAAFPAARRLSIRQLDITGGLRRVMGGIELILP